MTKFKSTIIILAALISAALFVSYCNGPKLIKGDTEYIYDTVTYKHSYSVPSTPDTVIYRDTIPTIVDTAAILKDYFAARNYSRTHEDSNIVITIKDTVSENKLGAWSVNYKWKKPVQVMKKEAPKSMVLLGADLSTASGLGINGSYLNKNIQYELGYYLNDKSIRVGVKYGFRFK
jgi:hypothetical protein